MATVTIANGQTTSDALNMGAIGQAAIGLMTPAALTGTTFTFLGSLDGSTYSAVYDKTGVQYSLTVSTSRYIVLPPADFVGIPYLKVIGGSSEGGDRILTIVTRPL